MILFPYKIILLFLLCSYLSSAQNPHPHFRNYTTDDGLPSPEVHYCIQDDDGYMWFATDNGLSRFDGYEFKNYGSREGLKHSVVFYMQKDPEGTIWLATMHGQLYYIDRDSIRHFAQNAIIEKINTRPNFIKDFYIDTNGIKYLSIINNGILKFPPHQRFERILPTKPTTVNYALEVNKRWISASLPVTDSIKNAYLNEALEIKNLYPLEIIGGSNYYLDSIRADKRQMSSGNWIKQLSNNQVIVLRRSLMYEIIKEKIAWKMQVPFDLELKSFIQDSNNRLLLGLHRGKGIRRYQNIEALRAGKFEQFLKGISITHIFQDKKGGYWIGTIENGIFYCPDFDLKIYDKSSDFPNDHIVAIDFKNDSECFVGFRDGQVISFEIPTNKMTMLPPLSNNILYDLLFDQSRQELWATNHRPNIFKGGKWKESYRPMTYNPIGKRMTISRDSTSLWGTTIIGFGSMNLDTKENSFYSYDIDIRQRTFRVWEDHQGRVWVGNVNGFFEFKNNKLESPQPYHQPFETRTEDIAELSDGTLVIATKGEGVLFWKKNYFHQLTTNEGLSSNMLENIYVDNRDQIWAGTLEGLNKITREGNNFSVKKITTFHGLPSNEITRVTSHQGQVWVSTTKGLIQWQEKVMSNVSPSPIIEATLVNNEPFNFQKKSILGYDNNDLEINFLTINYNLNGKIPYRFRINNGAWNLTPNRSVNFADLSPNQYQFEVQSQNENGIWSASTTLSFQIRPAFWQTWWFYFLIAGTLIGITRWIYKSRLKQLRAEAAMEREMNELQRAALRAQMNPHFIFNCLNSIQTFIVQNDQENATRYLAKFAQLIRGTLNVSMEEKISLKEEVALLENYLNLEKIRFKDQFNFQIHVDKQLNQFEILLPPLLTQPFVENAIIHGFVKMKSGGELKIDFLKKNEKFEIRIQDNGQGFYQSQKNKSPYLSRHNGVGMSISQKRLELADSLNEFEVKEIKDENNQVKGTLIRLVLEM